MPTFEGSLQLAGDATTKMPAGIRVDGGRLVILAGPSDEIGNWSLSKIDIRRKSGAFVLNVEGEQLLITVEDPDSFVQLVDINDDAPAAAPKKQERRSRGQRKERPPKEPRVKRSKRVIVADEPTIESVPETADETPVPSYLIDTPTTEMREPESQVPAAEEQPPEERVAKEKAHREKRPAREKKPPTGKKTSLFAALPLSWKVGAALVIAAILLGIFAPGALTAILMLTGMILLLVAVVVGSDSIVAARLPSSINSTNTLVAGVILLVLSALMMVAT
ncbi:MAG: hypothetical protein OEX97_03445 [Acidimicrobiia bacterium]|nr:hypothetical protein [Acidimicrobiia bacterium]